MRCDIWRVMFRFCSSCAGVSAVVCAGALNAPVRSLPSRRPSCEVRVSAICVRGARPRPGRRVLTGVICFRARGGIGGKWEREGASSEIADTLIHSPPPSTSPSSPPLVPIANASAMSPGESQDIESATTNIQCDRPSPARFVVSDMSSLQVPAGQQNATL